MSRVIIRPQLLRWARDRSRSSAEELDRQFPKLREWEGGESRPTLKQIESFARATRTPVGLLFLDDPPEEIVPIPDFRTIRDQRVRTPSPDLLETIYLCQQRQLWYGEFVRASGGPALEFVGSARAGDDVVATATRMRGVIGFALDEQRRLSTWTDALRRLIEHADSLGVLVMVSGVVGSNNRRKLNPDEFRGFALSDATAPLIFVNGADTKAAQMFTLTHELAHVFAGQSAVSDSQAATESDNTIERWCNRVAAEFLVPLAQFSGEYNRTTPLREEMNRLARRYKVSRLVVLRRMHDAGGLSREAMWNAHAAELTRLRALPKGSGGDFYLTLGARASKTFARALVVSTLEGRTPFTEAFRLLGFKKMATFREVGHSLGIDL